MKEISRRDFLKTGILGAGILTIKPWCNWSFLLDEWPDAERIGRVCVDRVDVRSRPSVDSQSLGQVHQDTVVVWLREVIGEAPQGNLGRRWVETPNGYIYAPSVQPVRNEPNQPLTSLPTTSMGMGMWVEVSVPYVDLSLENPPARSPWLQAALKPRLYYSQTIFVDQVRIDDQGRTLYRLNEKFGYGDIFWAAAEAFRPLTQEELAPINPGKPDKKVVVDTNHQVLSCFEGKDEVYFCRVSTGAIFNYLGEVVENWATPAGSYFIWRKLISIHMTGGTVSEGYDLPGIAWTCLFVGDGIAIHSTFWHNDYGTPRSHGCVNTHPDDAKWIFRWTDPVVNYDPGDITVQMGQSTSINVIQA